MEDTMKQAYEDGYAAGEAAAQWLLDGNSAEEDARALLQGLEDGDPAVYDVLPHSPLSGEWADDPTPQTLQEEYGVSDDDLDDLCNAYEDGYADGAHSGAEALARSFLGIPEGCTSDDPNNHQGDTCPVHEA